MRKNIDISDRELENITGLTAIQHRQIRAHEVAIERIKQGVCEGCGGDSPLCHTCLGQEFKKKHNK